MVNTGRCIPRVLYPAEVSRGWQKRGKDLFLGSKDARIQKNKTQVRSLKWLKSGSFQTTNKLFVGTQKEVVKREYWTCSVDLFHSHLRELLPSAPKAGPRYRFTLWPAAGTPCPIQTRCASLPYLRPYAVSKSLIAYTLAWRPWWTLDGAYRESSTPRRSLEGGRREGRACSWAAKTRGFKKTKHKFVVLNG